MIRLTRNSSIAITIMVIAGFFVLLGVTPSGDQKFPDHPEPKSLTVSPDASPSTKAAVTLNSFHRSETRDGRQIWEIRGERGEFFPLLNKAKLFKAFLTFEKSAEQKVFVESQQAEIEFRGTELQKAKLLGNVVVVYNEKTKINTDSATIENNQIFAPGMVFIENEGLKISGQGLEASTDSQKMSLSANVKTIIP